MTLEWYRNNLGIEYSDWGGFPDTTAYFAPSESPFMINFRVADSEALVAALWEGGVEVVGEIEQWEPVVSSEDPYLQEVRRD